MDQIMRPSANLSYDLQKSSYGSGRTYGSKAAATKEFSFVQKLFSKGFTTRDFGGSKGAWMGDSKFATAAANTKGKYALRDGGKKADVKTMPTSESPESRKAMAIRTLPDGNRDFLGPESKQIGRAVTPEEAANWRTGGGESVVNTGRSVEKFSPLKPMSIEDIRTLLNKNK